MNKKVISPRFGQSLRADGRTRLGASGVSIRANQTASTGISNPTMKSSAVASDSVQSGPVGSIPARNFPPTQSNPAVKSDSNLVARPTALESNGFSRQESALLKEAALLAKFEHLDGKGYIVIRSNSIEARLRRGGLEGGPHWAVLSIPLFDMNNPSAVEICLHFLVEAHNLAYSVDFAMQVGINMETEFLEVLLPLPLQEISPSKLGVLLKDFLDNLHNSIMSEIEKILQADI